MRYLLDTNIVLRTVNRDDGLHSLVVQALQTLSTRGHELVIVPQVIYEFWSVVSRPLDVNGLGWPPPHVRSVVDELTAAWTLLEDGPELYPSWLELVTTHQVAGRQVHDARLATAMQVHRLDALLTLNVADFERFGLQAVHPSKVQG
jgi:predicted nucleic acid-binding protein